MIPYITSVRNPRIKFNLEVVFCLLLRRFCGSTPLFSHLHPPYSYLQQKKQRLVLRLLILRYHFQNHKWAILNVASAWAGSFVYVGFAHLVAVRADCARLPAAIRAIRVSFAYMSSLANFITLVSLADGGGLATGHGC